jgi:hypothetical protein
MVIPSGVGFPDPRLCRSWLQPPSLPSRAQVSRAPRLRAGHPPSEFGAVTGNPADRAQHARQDREQPGVQGRVQRHQLPRVELSDALDTRQVRGQAPARDERTPPPLLRQRLEDRPACCHGTEPSQTPTMRRERLRSPRPDP